MITNWLVLKYGGEPELFRNIAEELLHSIHAILQNLEVSIFYNKLSECLGITFKGASVCQLAGSPCTLHISSGGREWLTSPMAYHK